MYKVFRLSSTRRLDVANGDFHIFCVNEIAMAIYHLLREYHVIMSKTSSLMRVFCSRVIYISDGKRRSSLRLFIFQEMLKKDLCC